MGANGSEDPAVFDGVEVYAPVIRPSKKSPRTLGTAFTLTENFVAPESVRVLIFPHHGPYSSPQGKEKVINQVKFESDANCTLHRADDKDFQQPIRGRKNSSSMLPSIRSHSGSSATNR